MRKKQHDTLARSAMKLLCMLLGLILAAMLALTVGFHQLLSRMNITSEPSVPGSTLLSVFSPGDSGGRVSALSVLSGQRRVINILLIGQDRREGESLARSDSMILCSLGRENGQLTMTSFLRDLYVPIPGHGSNRINAAYSFGGRKLLKQTLEENFGLTIDGCVEVDFQQFSQIIDLLGGVTLELRQDEAEHINRQTGSTLSEGIHTLTGQQALTYSRIRSLDLDGDFSRTDRQRKVITALLAACRDATPARLVSLVNQLLPMITTDLNQGQLLMLALEAVPNLRRMELTSQRIPADGTFSDDTIDGMQVLVADLEQTRQLLQDIAN